MRFKAEVISRVTLQWLEVATQGKKLPEYPAVDVSVIYPATLSLEEVGDLSATSLSSRMVVICLLCCNKEEENYYLLLI